MQVRGRARNLHVLGRLDLVFIGLEMEPQCPETTCPCQAAGAAVYGFPMPRASIHTNPASLVDVDVERLMDPIVMEVHENKAVRRRRRRQEWCNCRDKWNWLVK